MLPKRRSSPRAGQPSPPQSSQARSRPSPFQHSSNQTCPAQAGLGLGWAGVTWELAGNFKSNTMDDCTEMHFCQDTYNVHLTIDFAWIFRSASEHHQAHGGRGPRTIYFFENKTRRRQPRKQAAEFYGRTTLFKIIINRNLYYGFVNCNVKKLDVEH